MGRYLYVLNSGEGTVSIIDAESTREIRRADLDIRIGHRRGAYLSPRELATDVGGEKLFILCPFDDLLVCCDSNMEKVLFSQSVPSNPVSMTLSPDGEYCYVACADSDCIMQLSAHNGRQLAMVRTRPYPVDIMASDSLLCVCMNGRCITSYDMHDLIPLNTLALKGMPFSIAGYGQTAVISQLMCNEEWNGCLTRVDTDGIIPRKNIRLNIAPGKICETAQGYALAENGGKRLKFYNNSLECTGEIDAKSIIEGLLYDDATNLLYVSLPNSNAVAVYDCNEQIERHRLHVGLEPSGMIILDRTELP